MSAATLPSELGHRESWGGGSLQARPAAGFRQRPLCSIACAAHRSRSRCAGVWSARGSRCPSSDPPWGHRFSSRYSARLRAVRCWGRTHSGRSPLDLARHIRVNSPKERAGMRGRCSEGARRRHGSARRSGQSCGTSAALAGWLHSAPSYAPACCSPSCPKAGPTRHGSCLTPMPAGTMRLQVRHTGSLHSLSHTHLMSPPRPCQAVRRRPRVRR